METLKKEIEINTKDTITLRKEVLDQSIKNFNQNSETQMVLGSVKNDTHAIKNKMGIYFGSMIALGFIFGLLIGTQYKTWSPFVSDIYTTYKAVKGATK